jgi:hypothetical protein
MSRRAIEDQNMDSLASKATEDSKALAALLEEVSSKKESARHTSFKALLSISEERPEVLYSKWDFFADLIGSKNTSFKYIAIYIIANLTRTDTENRFEKIFEKYYGLLNDESVIPAAHVAGNSGKIARAKPGLQTRITNKLLNIDKTRYAPGRKELIKGYAIEAFGEYFSEAKDRQKIIEFVEKQLNSKSPRTKKTAQSFLEKAGK